MDEKERQELTEAVKVAREALSHLFYAIPIPDGVAMRRDVDSWDTYLDMICWKFGINVEETGGVTGGVKP